LSRARSAADLAFALDVLAGPRDPLMSAETLVSPRHTSPEGRRVAPWLDEPCGQSMQQWRQPCARPRSCLEKAGAIVDESARPAFSFEEAWKVFAFLADALIGSGPPDWVCDKLAAQEHDFLTGDLSHRAPQARGMRLSTPDFIGFKRGGRGFAGSGHDFSNIATWCFACPRSMANKGHISI
jgi:Asp-tRNA(Asn)/Glu-tRNA(Gln) amidotransferase A subunit family amidase